MIEKVKEHWNKCTVAEKILSVATPVLLIVIVVAETLLIFDVLATDVLSAVIKTAMAIGWALIGPVLWKKFRLLSICCFSIALVNIVHAVFLLVK